MTPTLNDPDGIEQKRDAVLETLADHLDDVAGVVAQVTGEDYGKFKSSVDDGAYVLKHEDGSVEWFRYTDDSGSETYLISTKSEPSPHALATGLGEYAAFIESVNSWVDNQDDQLEAADEQIEALDEQVAALDAEAVIEQRDATEQEAWAVVDELAAAVKAVTGDRYGTFAVEVDGEKWTLKHEEDGSAKYLQVGGTYVLGRDSPKPSALAAMLEDLPAFVDAVDRWLDEQGDATQYRLTLERTTPTADENDVTGGGEEATDDDN